MRDSDDAPVTGGPWTSEAIPGYPGCTLHLRDAWMGSLPTGYVTTDGGGRTAWQYDEDLDALRRWAMGYCKGRFGAKEGGR